MITEETMKHLTRVSPNNRNARLALALRNRHKEGKIDAYTIDPGMALAREICRREHQQQIIGYITSIVDDGHGIVVTGVLAKPVWAPPTTELVLDAFDIWAKGVS